MSEAPWVVPFDNKELDLGPLGPIWPLNAPAMSKLPPAGSTCPPAPLALPPPQGDLSREALLAIADMLPINFSLGVLELQTHLGDIKYSKRVKRELVNKGVAKYRGKGFYSLTPLGLAMGRMLYGV